MRVFFIRYSALGDIVLCYPFLKYLVDNNIEVYFLTHRLSKDIIGIDSIKYIHYKRGLGLIRTLKLVFSLHRLDFDLVIDFQNNKRSRILSWLIGSKEILRVKDNQNLHAIINYSKAFLNRFSDFHLKKHYNFKINHFNIMLPKRYVCVFFSSSKRWVSKRMPEKLGNRLLNILRKRGFTLVFVGGRDDIEYHKEFLRVGDIDYTGKLSIEELKYVFYKCEFMISTDSFPMHLASFCNTKVYAFFGPTDPKRCGPWGNKETVFYNKKSDCIFCYKSKCDDKRCFYEGDFDFI